MNSRVSASKRKFEKEKKREGKKKEKEERKSIGEVAFFRFCASHRIFLTLPALTSSHAKVSATVVSSAIEF